MNIIGADGLVDFSVVMPIHNEENLLSYSLPSVLKLVPDEVILIFDRCTDRSLEIAEEITKRYEFRSRTKLIELNKSSQGWKFRVAFLRRHGFRLAKNHVILNTDADLILDGKIVDYLHLVGKKNIGIVLFSRIPHPRTLQSLLGTLFSPFIPIVGVRVGFGGLYAFSKQAWLETENQESAKATPRAEDTHLRLSILGRHKEIFVKTKTLHLRPRETARYHFLKGVTRWQTRRESLLRVAIHSFMFLRPLVLSGYLKARLHNKELTGSYLASIFSYE